MTTEAATPWELDPYTSKVVEALVGDFPDLQDPIVASIVRQHVYSYVRSKTRLEVILDDLYFANWRLVGHDGHVRVACWRQNPIAAERERAERLNAALDSLSSDQHGKTPENEDRR
jgi:hypothetical protein